MGDNTKMKYSNDLADKFCALIIEGETIRDICALEDMPSVTTFFKWLREHENFAKQYARAKEIQAELFISEIVDIADDGRNDWMEKKLQSGEIVEVANHEHIQRSRVRIDSRKWLASKFMPKKYGDRIIHAGDADAPLRTETSGLTDSERQAVDRFLKNHPERMQTPEEQSEECYDDIC